MKSTGEVMAIGRNLEEATLKAVRSLEIGLNDLHKTSLQKLSNDSLEKGLIQAQDDRLFYIAEALQRGYSL